MKLTLSNKFKPVFRRLLPVFISLVLACLLVVNSAFPALAAFVGTSTITINGTFADWGTVAAPTTGVYVQQDASNSGQDDGTGFNGKSEDLNYVWTATSTQNGTSPASPFNLIQNFYYRIDTLNTANFTGTKFNIQLNLGTAGIGYADHLLQLWVDNGSTPTVKITLFQYGTPYPAMRAFTTGTITGVVSNVAAPFSGYTGAVDPSATGAIGTYTYNATTYYALEFNVPVGWFGSTYGGAIKNDGTGASSIIGSVFSSTGSYGAVGTPKDALNNASNRTLITYTSSTAGDTSFVTTDISKIAFTTSAQSITAGVASTVMTVQTQDGTNAPQNVTANTTINLSSSSGTGTFSTTSGGTYTSTLSVTITTGTNSVNFYYKDTTAGTPTITAAENPSQSWTDATQQETVNAAAISKIIFTTTAQSLTAGVVSSIMTIQTQDQYSNAKTVSGDTVVALSSNTSGTATFYSDSGGTNVITSVTISSGSSTANFYYKDTAVGTPTITADENPSAGYTAATQQQTVSAASISKIAFTTSGQTLTAGVISSIMTIQTQDQLNNAKNVTGDTVVDLSSNSSGTKTFYSDSGGTNQITSVTISNGSNSASFYYKDTKSGTPTITADENPSQGWTAATQQQTVNAASISKIVFTTGAQNIDVGAASAVMTVQTQDQYGNPKNVSADTTIALSSSAGTGAFSTTSGGTYTSTLSITITNGSSTANFYYKDTAAGTPTITADENPSAGYTAATQQETITGGTPSITNSPGTYAFGIIVTSSTPNTGLTYFTVTNDGSVTVNITISATDMAGGATWTLSDTGTPGADTYGLRAGLEGGSYNIIVKKTGPYNTLVSGLTASASQRWGLQLSTPTSFSDGGTKSGTVTLTATQA